MTYSPRHAATDPLAIHNAFDPSDPHDAYERDEVVSVLRGMPLDPEHFGDSSTDDWSLSILVLLAGWGDEDSADYLMPRVQAAARVLLAEVGCPGDAFAGLRV
jgi:hypothetical protein